MTRRRRRRNVSPHILGEIEEQMQLEPPPSAAKIHEHLKGLFGTPFEAAKHVPSLRTVQEIVAEMSLPPDESGRWALLSAEPDDIPLVVPVLMPLAEATRGERREITVAEAGALARVRRAAPDLPLLAAYQTARLYLARGARKEPTTDIDFFLSSGAWRDEATAQRYYDAVYEGWAPVPPTLLSDTVSDDFAIEHRVIGQIFHRSDIEPDQLPPIVIPMSPRQVMEGLQRAKAATDVSATKAPKAKPQKPKRKVKK